jgi:hypothetical protein
LAKAPTRRLKVFQAQFGFHDSVVAAPSQAAALRAWGTHQNLFADGQARITTDPKAVAAALANPETPLLRAVGSDDPFALKPTALPKVPDAPKRPSAKPAAKAKPEPPPKPQANRSALDAAEASLRKLDDARKREEADLRRRQDDLDQQKADAQAAYVEQRKAATAAVIEARQAYRKAGGDD